MEDRSIRKMGAAMFDLLGQWLAIHGEAIYELSPSDIEVENKLDDFILVKVKTVPFQYGRQLVVCIAKFRQH